MKTVWTIGRFDLPDAEHLAREREALRATGSAVSSFTSPAEAIASSAACPDLIVVVQHRPREFSPGDVAALLASQPLAAFVVALGSWCAASPRSERLWPDSIAVPLWEAVDRMRRHAAAIAGTIDRLPLTASRDEALLFDLETSATALRGLVVSIATPDRAFRDLLSDVVTDFGAAFQPLERLPGSGIVLWDVTTGASDALAKLEAMRSRHPGCRLIAMMALPTAADAARFRAAGVAAIVPKPFAPRALASTILSVL